jgi:hypothetical protein
MPGRAGRETLVACLHAEELITHRFPLTGINDGLAAMRDRPEPMWMGVVKP